MTSSAAPSSASWPLKGIDDTALAAMSADLPASQVWSLLLHVIGRRAGMRTAAQLLEQFERDRFVWPATVDLRVQLELDLALFAAAESFEAIELSPLAPLGTCSVVAPTSQNRIVASVRGTETVSDPTNVMALECARRLRANASQVVKLATSHRCTRAQPVPKGSGFAAHFRLFCLASAGHESKDQAFTRDALAEHIRIHLRAIDHLAQRGYRIPPLAVKLLSTPQRRHVAERIAADLGDVRTTIESLSQPYYCGLRFMISVQADEDSGIPLTDGGAFDWVGTLAANRKLAFVASAIGSQLIANRYRSER